MSSGGVIRLKICLTVDGTVLTVSSKVDWIDSEIFALLLLPSSFGVPVLSGGTPPLVSLFTTGSGVGIADGREVGDIAAPGVAVGAAPPIGIGIVGVGVGCSSGTVVGSGSGAAVGDGTGGSVSATVGKGVGSIAIPGSVVGTASVGVGSNWATALVPGVNAPKKTAIAVVKNIFCIPKFNEKH
jgi:hypothetical protein